MANQRDVKLTLSVETLGAEEIQQLQKRVLELGKEAGDASPEFAELAAKIGLLGEQADAIRSFEALSARVDELRSKQQAAADQTTDLKSKLDTFAEATQKAADRQASAANAFTEARAGLSDLRGQIEILGKTYDTNGDRVANFRSEVERLTREKIAQKKVVEEARAALATENAALAKAEAAQSKLEKSYQRSTKSLESSTKALTAQQVILDQSSQSLRDLGLASDDLAAAQAQVVTALNATGAAAQTARAAIEATRQAQSQAADEARLAAIQEETLLAQRKQAANERIGIERDITAAVKREAAGRAAAEKAAADQAAAATQELAVKARAAAQALNDAFGTLGIRSVQELEREILQVRTAMQKVQDESGQTGTALTGAMNAGKARIAELERALRGVRNELTLTDKAANLFKSSLGQIAAGNLVADAVGSLVEKVKELGRQFITVNVQAETMTRGLNAIYKSSEIASSQIEFLRNTATRAGLSISEISDSFVRFNAATASSNIPLKQSNELFAAVAQASVTLGLSSQRTTLALDALGQIASKGVVSMEELRQQLGDSVPGALSLTAKGLGIADQELIKLVESGNLASRDFFPAFTKGLKTLSGETDGIQASFNRFKTTLTLVAQSIGEAGFITILTGAIKVLGGAFSGVVIVVASFAEYIGLATKAAVALFGALRGDGVTAMNFFEEEVAKSAARINTMRDSMFALINPTGEAAKRLEAAGAASAKTGEQATIAAAEVSALSAKYTEVTSSALQYESAQDSVALASKIASDATVEYGSRIVQLGVQLGTIAAAQENDVAVRTKATKAVTEQAAASVELAKIAGNEPALVEAQIAANNLLIESVGAEATAREAYVGTLSAQLDATRKLAEAEGSLADRKLILDALSQKIEKAEADARATRAQAASYEALRTSLEQNRLAFKDNSAEVDKLRAAFLAAKTAVDTTRAAFVAGAATAEDYRVAQVNAAAASARLKDALNDQTASIAANTRSKEASNSLEVAGLQLALATAKADEDRARRLGLENSLRIALIRQKEIEIAIDKLKTDAMRIEAEGTIALTKAKRDAALASGTLTDVMKIELDTQIKLAEIKTREAQIIGVSIRAREEELARIKARAQELDGETEGTKENSQALRENADSRDMLSDSIDRESASRERNASARGREAAASNQLSSSDRGADGRTDSERERLSKQGGPVDSSLPFLLQERQARGDKFTAQDVPLIESALRALEQNAQNAFLRPGAVSLSGRRDVDGRITGLQQLLDQVRSEQDTETQRSAATKESAARPSAPSAPAGQIVNINIGGVSQQVRVADAASAANLESVLRQLASSASRTA